MSKLDTIVDQRLKKLQVEPVAYARKEIERTSSMLSDRRVKKAFDVGFRTLECLRAGSVPERAPVVSLKNNGELTAFLDPFEVDAVSQINGLKELQGNGVRVTYDFVTGENYDCLPPDSKAALPFDMLPGVQIFFDTSL